MDALNFKEWFSHLDTTPLSDSDIVNLYFHDPNMKVKEISLKSGKSIGEVYRILHKYGSPNRQITNHETVISYDQAGFPIKKIAEFSGYTPRNIRYILKKHKRE